MATSERSQITGVKERVALSVIVAIGLLTVPTPVQAPKSLRSKENNKIATIEAQYPIVLKGSWTDEELNVLESILVNLPESLMQANPGKLTQVEVNKKEEGLENASCTCFTYTNEGNELEPNKVELGDKILENPKLARLIVTHELIHARSDMYLQARRIKDGWTLRAYLWHADMLNEILQKPFPDFAEEIDEKLQRQYPEQYKLVLAKYAQTKDPNTIQKLPKSFGEQMTAKKMKEFNKVARWLYAISKGPYSNMYANMESKYPIEFIPVLAEWYIQGKEVFMYNMEGVISKEMAEELYALLKYQFFEGYEYTQDGKAIKTPKRQEVTPLRRGRY